MYSAAARETIQKLQEMAVRSKRYKTETQEEMIVRSKRHKTQPPTNRHTTDSNESKPIPTYIYL